MGHAIRYTDYRIAGPVDLVDMAERLSDYGDLTANMALGVRFEPDHEGWPPTYFTTDGTIHLVAGQKSMELEELISYIGFLSEVLGCSIEEDGRAH